MYKLFIRVDLRSSNVLFGSKHKNIQLDIKQNVWLCCFKNDWTYQSIIKIVADLFSVDQLMDEWNKSLQPSDTNCLINEFYSWIEINECISSRTTMSWKKVESLISYVSFSSVVFFYKHGEWKVSGGEFVLQLWARWCRGCCRCHWGLWAADWGFLLISSCDESWAPAGEKAPSAPPPDSPE